MKLEFELKPSYGRLRFYPLNDAAGAVVALTKRVCLTSDELESLERAGFEVKVLDQTADKKVGAL